MERTALIKSLIVNKEEKQPVKYDKKAIESLLNQLIKVIYDGYFLEAEESEMLFSFNVAYDYMAKILNEEIAYYFFNQISEIREVLAGDLQAIFDGDPAATNKQEIILSYPGFYAITVHRIAHKLYLAKENTVARMMSEIVHSATGIDIHPGANIGNNFFIDHGTGIVIGETTIIGQNVKLYQGVTLGAISTRGGQSLKGLKRHPNIEDNVTLYAGASVLGNVTIGANCVIGSNVFITKDVEADTTVYVKYQKLNYHKK